RAWLSALFQRRRTQTSSRKARTILRVEELEPRLTPVAGDFLVSNAQNLQVYSFTGQFQSSEVIPVPGDTPALHLIADHTAAAGIQVFNGTQTPFLSSTTDKGVTWNHVAPDPVLAAGWSTTTDGTTGGIAAIGNFVFTTDMDVSGDGNGIIRWDLTDGS